MGAALPRRRHKEEPLTCPSPLIRYRIVVFGEPRAPWRSSPADAMADAIDLGLASWDASQQEHFLAVPVDMRVWHMGDDEAWRKWSHLTSTVTTSNTDR